MSNPETITYEVLQKRNVELEAENYKLRQKLRQAELEIKQLEASDVERPEEPDSNE